MGSGGTAAAAADGGAPMLPLADIPLKAADGTELKAGQLWADKPAVIVILRRPGCILCRYQASELWEKTHAEFEKQGVRVVCVVHEWIDREIDAFKPEFWPGELYHDVDKRFFKHLGNGELLYANLWSLLNPVGAVWSRIFNAKKKIKDHNMAGTGNILGGLLVVGMNGEVQFKHVERELGMAAEHDDVRLAVRKVTAAA